jgi:isocitrate dehydrogenase (NAD+)
MSPDGVAQRVVLVPGDGIGPEVTHAARRALDATGVAIDWVEAHAGEDALRERGAVLPAETIAAVREVGTALKGPMTNPVAAGYDSPNIGLRTAAELYANVRLAEVFPGVESKFPGTDLVVIRDVTEDVYKGAQQAVGPDAAIAVKFITRAASERIARFAFEFARAHGRRRVTVAHKAATLKATDGLFLTSVLHVAASYPDIDCDEELIDALAMRLVRTPEQFDVLLAPFQYGDILADLCAGLVGGLGVVPGASFGAEAAFFEAAHGSAPKYAGQDRANPTAMILSGVLMLRHLGELDAADRLQAAVQAVLAAGEHTTPDIGGPAGTRRMTDAVIRALG